MELLPVGMDDSAVDMDHTQDIAGNIVDIAAAVDTIVQQWAQQLELQLGVENLK